MSSTSAPTYKLTYFNLRGLGETSRMLFKLAGQEFEDFRYPFALQDGQRVMPEWLAAKPSYVYEKIPVLEVNEGGKFVIAQSKAIERFLARRFNMLGSNDIEAALIDAACEQIADVKTAYGKAKTAGDADVKKFFEEDLKKSFAAFEKQAAKNQSGFWIGSRLSLFDVQLFNLIHFFDDQQSVQKALEGNKALKAIHDKVEQTPELKKWMAERPQTVM